MLVACGGAPSLIDDTPIDTGGNPMLNPIKNESCKSKKVAPTPDDTYTLTYKRLYSDDFSYLLTTCTISDAHGLINSNTVLIQTAYDFKGMSPCWVQFSNEDESSGGFDFVQENDGSNQVAAHFHLFYKEPAEGVWHLDCE